MKAIILARVSTEEQINEGQSIPAQINRAREYARKKDLDIISEHQFDESSIKDKRVKFDKVIHEIKKAKDTISLIVETVDRLQRSFKESVLMDEFRKSGKVELHFIRENLIIHKDSNSSEIQRWDLAVFVAKSYVLQISDNVKRTIERKIKNGECLGKAPIGYLNISDDRGKNTVIIDKRRGPFIKRIYELYSTGLFSMKTIADMMYKEGFRSKYNNSNKLNTSKIEFILKNPFYYGQIRHKGELYSHMYEPIIDYTLWKACEDVRKSYDKTKKLVEKPFVFQGMIKCANCGCAITAEIKKKKFIYYHCTNYYGNCKKIYVNQERLLENIYDLFKLISLPQEKIDDLIETLKSLDVSKKSFNTEQKKLLTEKIENMEKKMRMMYEDRLEGRITEAQYDKMVEKYKQSVFDTELRRSQLRVANVRYYITAGQVLTLAKNATELFKSSIVAEKRELLKIIISNLKLKGKKLQYKLKTPFKEVLLANTTPCMLPLVDTFSNPEVRKQVEDIANTSSFRKFDMKFLSKSEERLSEDDKDEFV